MLKALLRRFGIGRAPAAPADTRPRRQPGARYDNADTGPENREHWSAADSLSPNAATSPHVRRTLRERARYEAANNSIAFGVVTSRVCDLIGTGPRLSLTLPDDGDADTAAAREEGARRVEAEFARWAAAVDLAGTLRTLKRAELVDGEGFALRTTDPTVRHPVHLRLRPFECDLVTDPTFLPVNDPLRVDGIKYDAHGNPRSYTVLRAHPGDGWGRALESDDRPAADVYHVYRAERPGQARGVSWLTPALGLFAILRRYTLAVLGSAETAANIAAWVKTDVPPGADPAAPAFRSMEEIEIPRRAILALPPGADIGQMTAEQPTTGFGDFRKEICLEIGRCLDLPLNFVTGNSSGYNFSSGRLDHLPYHRKLWVERDQLAVTHLDRLLRDWLDEAALAGLIPDGLPPVAEWSWDWHWDSPGDVDPVKEATAAEKLLANNLTTMAEQCAARGQRWQDVLRQRKREQDFADALGLRGSAEPAAVAASRTAPDADDAGGRDDEEESREV